MKSVNDTSDITLTWATAGVTLELSFKGGAVWYMSAVSMKSGNFSGSATYGPDSLNKYFQAQSNHSYQCTEDRNVTLKDKKAEGIVDFVSLQVQPFAAKNATSEACPSKVNPNPDNSIVPIAVGCALAGLIVIVLIAYLIGRKKGGGRGYQKV
jgi:lysosomal-associated membrane protein 1/2